MRLVFFGTAPFAIPALRLLHSSGHDVAAVVTAAPRPAGRGRRLLPGPVMVAAETLGLRVLAPADPHAPEVIAALAECRPDAGVLAAYGVILKPDLLRLPRLGIVNIHPSLLPAHRGAAPIQRQLINGETRTGVTIIALSDKVDAGDILAQAETPAGPDETGGELTARLARLGADLLLSTLPSLERGTAPRRPQDPALATLAPRLTRRDRVLDWSRPARELHNRIRALSPEPGAVTLFRGRRLLVLRSRLQTATANEPPGTIVRTAKGLSVACSEGTLELLEVSPDAGRIQTGQDFRNGHRPQPGEKLEQP